MLTMQNSLTEEDLERVVHGSSLEPELEKKAERGDSGYALNTGATFSGANNGRRGRSCVGQQKYQHQPRQQQQ